MVVVIKLVVSEAENTSDSTKLEVHHKEQIAEAFSRAGIQSDGYFWDSVEQFTSWQKGN